MEKTFNIVPDYDPEGIEGLITDYALRIELQVEAELSEAGFGHPFGYEKAYEWEITDFKATLIFDTCDGVDITGKFSPKQVQHYKDLIIERLNEDTEAYEEALQSMEPGHEWD